MKRARQMDRPLLGLTLLLLVAGVVALFSASAPDGMPAEGVGHGTGYLLRRLVQISLGLALMLMISMADYRWLRRLAGPAAVLSAGLLVVVLFAPAARGARSWLSLPGFSLQPVDVARISLLLLMAKQLAERAGEPSARRRFGPALAVLGVTVGLIACQPDLGSAMALAFCGALLLVIAGLPWRWLLVTGLAALVLGGGAYAGVERVRERVDLIVRFDPHEDRPETYQLKQSLIGLGTGGWVGQGPGASRQKLFLPDHHTDFIAAIVGEEYGLAGMLVLVVLLSAMLLRILRIARRQSDPFAVYLAAGMGGMLFVYVALNLAVAVGRFPLTGVPLPFISHGGSALVMNCAAIGLVLCVSREHGDSAPMVQAPLKRARRGEPVLEDLFRGDPA